MRCSTACSSSRPIDVAASNVTIRNTRIIATGERLGLALRHTANVTIQDSEIYSPDGDRSHRLMVGIKDIYGDSTGLQVLRNDISTRRPASRSTRADRGQLHPRPRLHDAATT